MKIAAIAILLAACSRREVTITLADKSVVHVETSTFADRHTEVSVHATQAIIPLIVIPVPVPYRAAPALAEKP